MRPGRARIALRSQPEGSPHWGRAAGRRGGQRPGGGGWPGARRTPGARAATRDTGGGQGRMDGFQVSKTGCHVGGLEHPKSACSQPAIAASTPSTSQQRRAGGIVEQPACPVLIVSSCACVRRTGSRSPTPIRFCRGFRDGRAAGRTMRTSKSAPGQLIFSASPVNDDHLISRSRIVDTAEARDDKPWSQAPQSPARAPQPPGATAVIPPSRPATCAVHCLRMRGRADFNHVVYYVLLFPSCYIFTSFCSFPFRWP